MVDKEKLGEKHTSTELIHIMPNTKIFRLHCHRHYGSAFNCKTSQNNCRYAVPGHSRTTLCATSY